MSEQAPPLPPKPASVTMRRQSAYENQACKAKVIDGKKYEKKLRGETRRISKFPSKEKGCIYGAFDASAYERRAPALSEHKPNHKWELKAKEIYVPAASANIECVDSVSSSSDPITSTASIIQANDILANKSEYEKPSLEVPPRPTADQNESKPPILWFLVEHAYQSEEEGIIQAKEGDLLRIDASSLENSNDLNTWIYCINLKGEAGCFPGTYGRIITDQDELLNMLKNIPHAVVITPFSSIDPKDLTVAVGDVVYLTSLLGQSYSAFKSDGLGGIVPAQILKIIHPL